MSKFVAFFLGNSLIKKFFQSYQMIRNKKLILTKVTVIITVLAHQMHSITQKLPKICNLESSRVLALAFKL
jgi:hypothetical protein